MTLNQKPKILFIEDDVYLCHAYQDGFGKAGFDFIITHDVREGLAKAKSENPGLILLDLLLPGESGFELLRKIKSDEKLKDIPVIILSNLVQDTDIRKGKEFGAVEYLVKTNVSMKDVIEIAKAYLAKSKL